MTSFALSIVFVYFVWVWEKPLKRLLQLKIAALEGTR